MRHPLTRKSDLLNAIQSAGWGASGVITNWFASPDQVQYWIDRDVLSIVEFPRGVLIFRRDRDFHHIYHVAMDREALSAALASLGSAAATGDVLTSDIVGRPEDVQAIAGIYNDHGFREHNSLFRMVRSSGFPHVEDPRDPEVVFGEAGDVDPIRGFFDRLLDRFTDQIPEPDEIRRAVARHNVILIRRGQGLGGMLLFETTGLTSVLRYWYVNPEYRDQRIGGRLIKTFFHLCRPSKRIILWVDSDNTDGIAKYRHYGFTLENLVDRIMIKEGEART